LQPVVTDAPQIHPELARFESAEEGEVKSSDDETPDTPGKSSPVQPRFRVERKDDKGRAKNSGSQSPAVKKRKTTSSSKGKG